MGLVLDSFICPGSFMRLTGWHMIISGGDRCYSGTTDLHIIFRTVMLGFLLLLSTQEKA
jgi:hypothetical protein